MKAALVTCALVLSLFSTACVPSTRSTTTISGEAGSSSVASTVTPSTPVTAAPKPLPADVAHLTLTLVPLVRGLDHPDYLTNAGDGSGRLFVVEQTGRVRVIRDGKLLAEPYLDLTSQISFGGERGLLGMAFAPDFKRSGRVYFDYTDPNGNTVIAEGVVRDPTADTAHFRSFGTLLHIAQPYPNHNGGCLQFGPDGCLWIGMGDGGSAGDPGNRAQDPRVLLGKLLRIDPQHATGTQRSAISPDQPMRAGWAPEIWAIGLRNPWRFSFDASGGALWIADVGQDAWEEIDVVDPRRRTGGLDFGWPLWEGTHPYRPNPPRDGYTFPIYDYPHPSAESITGGYVYRGSAYPALVGTYLYGDFVKGWLAALRTTAPDGTPLAKVQTRVVLRGFGQPSSFGVDESGELYVVDYGGTVYRIAAEKR